MAHVKLPIADRTRTLAWASLTCLVIAGTVAFLCCILVVYLHWRRVTTRGGDSDFDWKALLSHSRLFAILAVLSSTDIELVKLFPWRSQIYDGFPHLWVPTALIGVTLLEDVPQLICQLTYVATVNQSSQLSELRPAQVARTIAWVSIATTLSPWPGEWRGGASLGSWKLT